MRKVSHRFRVGDEVELVKPFRYDPDDEDDDAEFDENIRNSGNRGTIVHLDEEGYEIDWVGEGNLYCNEDCVDLILKPATDAEIAEAIASIGQVSLG